MHRIVFLSPLLVLALAVSSGFGASSGNDKITLCHGTSGSWNAIAVSVNAVSGHEGHSEDIIPAFTTVDNKGNVTNYPGKNLGTDFGGQSGGDVLGNGCAAPVVPPAELGHLTVIVKVVNNDGGTKVPSDFNVTASGNGRSVRFAGQDTPGWRYTGEPGNYTVTQSREPGYTTSQSGCSGALEAGGDATCVFVNDDIREPQPPQTLPAPWERPPKPPTEPTPFPTRPVVPAPPVPAPLGPPGTPSAPLAPVPPFATLATLTVAVKVINDDGGTAVPSRFGVLITGIDVIDGSPSFPGSSAGTTRTVAPGGYVVQQSTLIGYSTSYSPGCRGTVGQGGSAACAIVNNDNPTTAPPVAPPPTTPPEPGGQPATLTVITVVSNATGGSLTPANFVDLISGTPVVSGTPFFRGRGGSGVTRVVQPGSYGVFQNKRLNYERTYTRACSGSIQAGEHRTCVVVNRQQQLPSNKLYDLALTKTGPTTVAPGSSVTFELVVSNAGAARAPRVGVADRIPARFTYVEARGAACSARSTVVICQVGTLRRGMTRTLQLTYRAPASRQTSPTTAAVLGTSYETTFRNNVARIVVHVLKPKVCPDGARLFEGVCHPIVAGSG
jgi:uncharacterized repeat protein (TIGR01451 family)